MGQVVHRGVYSTLFCESLVRFECDTCLAERLRGQIRRESEFFSPMHLRSESAYSRLTNLRGPIPKYASSSSLRSYPEVNPMLPAGCSTGTHWGLQSLHQIVSRRVHMRIMRHHHQQQHQQHTYSQNQFHQRDYQSVVVMVLAPSGNGGSGSGSGYRSGESVVSCIIRKNNLLSWLWFERVRQ